MSKFLDLINKQRSEKKEEKFEGTFLEYLEKLQDNSDIAKPAHKRLYDAIKNKGVNKMDNEDPRKKKIFNDDNIKIYDYFKDEFFGNERVIEKLMHFLKSASLRGEESRQVLLLMGPVGAGKSALTEHIKDALDGEVYYHLDGDPQKGEPLQLVPRSLRGNFEEMLGVKIEGDLSPVARWRLLEEYKGLSLIHI
mgnify:FL=1